MVALNTFVFEGAILNILQIWKILINLSSEFLFLNESMVKCTTKSTY
jgi:hypothetical protein